MGCSINWGKESACVIQVWKEFDQPLIVFIIASEVIGTQIQWDQVGPTKVFDSQLCIRTDHVP